MTEFKTDISENGKKFELVFQTDNKAYFEKMQSTARECVDHKPVTQFDCIKAMSVEEMADFIKSVALGLNSDWVRGNIQEWLESEVSE